jgi:periplasmic divalent cation tolerance protein
MSHAIQVVTATATQQDAQKIATALVTQRLAACAQVLGPIRSTYRWKGQIESADEWLCLAKTLHTHYEAVQSAIRDLHSYEVPEIVATPLVAASEAYLAWIRAEVAADESQS